MNTLNIIRNTITKHKLIDYGDTIVVGLSGGADSCCLLHTLLALSDEYNLKIIAAHINHNLRSEADDDQKFAESLCKALGVHCYVKSADISEFSQKNKISEETAGRQIRYEFFDEVAKITGADKIATAHNRNDNCETIIMNFMRGSGLSGLCGIPYRRSENIIRPILDLSREQIEKYCKENKLNYVTDKTNFEAIYTRNKIRLELIPFIEQNFNSAFINRSVENAKIISDENDFLNSQAEYYCNKYTSEKANRYELALSDFSSLHIALKRRILIKILQKKSGSDFTLSSKYIDLILSLCENVQTGKKINLPGNIVAAVSYGSLVIANKSNTSPLLHEQPIFLGENIINDTIITVSECSFAKNPSKNIVYININQLNGLKIRTRKNGDFFYPFGMTGKKKLKDYFIDLKIPADNRDNIPILANAQDDILWIAGKRADRRFCADVGSKCLKITFTNDKKG